MLDIVSARLLVIETVRPKYACRHCKDGVKQGPAPAYLIESALQTEGAIAHVPVSKYADHLPLYRQSQIMSRAGIDIHRSTLADWVGKAAFHLDPIAAEGLSQIAGFYAIEKTSAACRHKCAWPRAKYAHEGLRSLAHGPA